jgi:PAS domain S-box-containing protein
MPMSQRNISHRNGTDSHALEAAGGSVWQQALDAIPSGIALVDPHSLQTIWINQAMRALLARGIGAESVIGQSPEEYLPGLDKTTWQEALRALDTLPEDPASLRRRLQFVHHATRNIAYWEWTLQRLAGSERLGGSEGPEGAGALLLSVQGVSEIVINERLLATAGRTADRARRHAEALVNMMRIVNAPLNTADLLRAITHEAASYFDSPYAAVLLLQPGQDHFTIGDSLGLQAEAEEALCGLNRSDTLAGRVLAEGRALALSDPAGSGIRTPLLQDGQPPKTLISSPIFQGGRTYGVVEVYFHEAREVPEEALALLSAYADQAGVALLKSDLYEQIAEQRRQLQSIFDHAPVGIVYLDPNGIVVNANAAAARRFGQPLDAMIGRHLNAFMSDVPSGVFEQACLGAPFHASHFVYRQENGAEVVCDLSLLPIRDKDVSGQEGRVAGLLLLSFDVTELVAARQEAEDALAEVRAAQSQMVQMEKMRALGELASGVAHDFNNALMAILGYTELAEEDLTDAQALSAHLAIIRKAAEDASSTVQRLQRFARQRVVAHGQPTDINAVVKDVIEMTRPRWRDAAQKEGRTYEVHADLGPLPSIVAEPSGLREVLTNIVYNALNAMPDGGKLTLTTRMPTEQEVEIEIADSGVGMPPEVMERIFDPFFTTRGVEGSGLGLSVSWTIIQRHEGSIKVNSTPGKGTSFVIRLPVGDPETVRVFAPERLQHRPVTGIDVLVVDDEPVVASVLSSILSRQGYRVTVVYSADSALARLNEEPHHWDVVLTDHGMPGKNGLQLVAEVKRLRPDLPVLLLTGWGETVLRAHVAETLPDVILSKPINQSDLLTAVSSVLPESLPKLVGH